MNSTKMSMEICDDSKDNAYFKITFKSNHLLCNTIKYLSELSNNVNVAFNKNGITIQSVDSCLVILTDIHFHQNDFKSFEVSKNTNVILGINLNEFYKAISCSPQNTMI